MDGSSLPEPGLPGHVNIAIVGTGFSGLGVAIRLAHAGRRDFVVLERGDDVGGTWRDNTYPGAACDVPSRLYSFSFRLNPDWTRTYSPQPEILEYLRTCAREAGILPHLRLRTELTDAAWDAAAGHWRIETSRGTFTAGSLVLGTGALVEPALPGIGGLTDFAGTVFHSARWNHEHDLTGRQVAVVGTGASAIQFVPHVARAAGHLSLFQRTPPWVVPRPDRAVHPVERCVYRWVPFAHRVARAGVYGLMESRALGFVGHPKLLSPVERIALHHMRRAVSDPELRTKLTPNYHIGCKRILVSNDYYPALAAPNVDVVTTGIECVEPDGIRTTDGLLHPADTLILGTGFRVTDNPGLARIRGRDGCTLEQAWADGGMHAYLGTTVPGFPNLFLLLGPNTGIGHTSAVFMIECQIGLVVQSLEHLRAHQLTELEVRPEVEQAYNAELAARSERSVWKSGCASWYLDAAGRNTVLWPDLTFRFRKRTRRFRPDDYLLRTRSEVTVEAPAPLTVG
ncbi:MAG TPA: NAD(P)/FAD-dependent oxidoreductase [Sporichthyaceae bacterium]|jgi:cation diffusion facilitator CzcD-associated flavoprotein CzcO|nr:NAD(P)/FAD-dependent oxidoreductase [Sporichthyaceae bacterium]